MEETITEGFLALLKKDSDCARKKTLSKDDYIILIRDSALCRNSILEFIHASKAKSKSDALARDFTVKNDCYGTSRSFGTVKFFTTKATDNGLFQISGEKSGGKIVIYGEFDSIESFKTKNHVCE